MCLRVCFSLFLLILLLAGCGESTSPVEPITSPKNVPVVEGGQSEGTKTIGLTIAGSDACYDAASDVFEHFAKQEGWQVLRSDSQYKKELETLNVDEFIAKKVDAVVMITTDIDTAGKNTLHLNAAGIPTFFMMTLPRFPAGAKAEAIVTTDWYMTGYLNGEYIAKHQPGARCAMIEGGYDQGMTELMRGGFLEGLASHAGGDAQVVANVTGSWMKPNARVAMGELLKKPDAFNCIFTGNEEMMLGVVEVLEEEKRLGQYQLYSENGRPDVSGELIPKGVMTATADAATTQEGEIAFQLVKAYFDGETIPQHVYSPVKLLTKENIEQAIPWDKDTYLAAKEAGHINIEFRQLEQVSEARPWDTSKNNYDNIYFHK